MACFKLNTWLTEYYPFLNWEHEFRPFLNPEVLKTANAQDNGFTFFIRGLNTELIHKNYAKALEMYNHGARYLDPLCLFRLHEIFLGNTFFGVDYDEVKSIVYLLWSAQFVLDINLHGPVSPIKKLVKFLIGFDKTGDYSVNLITLCEDPHLSPSKDLVRTLFLRNYFNNTDQKLNEQALIDAVSTLSQKNSFANHMFSMTHIGITRCYWATIKEKRKAMVLLDALSGPDVVDTAFAFQKVLFDMCIGSEARIKLFSDWLAVFTFFWEYAFLSPNKGQHLKYLCQISDTLIKAKLMKDEINIWWVKFYTGYSYEKGYLGENNEDKALEVYETSIQTHEKGLFPPLRKAILLKKRGQNYLAKAAFVKFEENFLKRNKEDHPCFFGYIMGKANEKYLDNVYDAILQYDQGVRAEGKRVSEYLVMFNEYWRVRCERRRDKIIKRIRLTRNVETNKMGF